MSDLVHAPFTPEQVEALNKYQTDGFFHPFTCGRCRDADTDYEVYEIGNEVPVVQWNRYERKLVATETGWVCPDCGYTQDWAHAFMADAARHPQNPFARG